MRTFPMIFSTLLILPSISTRAEIIQVPDDFRTIQDAVDAAADGDEIRVAAGTYPEWVFIRGKAITLRSESGPLSTILEPDAGPPNAGVFIGDLISGTVTIEGFTVQNSEAWPVQTRHLGDDARVRVIGNRFVDNPSFGAVSLFSGSGHEIVGNEFIGNTGSTGGAIYAWTSARIEDNLFEGNVADGGGGGSGSGGAITLSLGETGASPVYEVFGNTFAGNRAHWGGAIAIGGWGPSAFIVGNTFIDNESDPGGGIVSAFRTFGHAVEGNLFVGNSGGISLDLAEVIVRNNTIVDTHTDAGILISPDPGVNVIERNVVVGGDGPGISVDDIKTVVRCNVLHENAGGDLVGVGVFVDNLFTDPLFCDPGAGEYGVQSNSPCLPEGNPCGVLIGAFGEACGSTPVVPISWGGIKAQFTD